MHHSALLLGYFSRQIELHWLFFRGAERTILLPSSQNLYSIVIWCQKLLQLLDLSTHANNSATSGNELNFGVVKILRGLDMQCGTLTHIILCNITFVSTKTSTQRLTLHKAPSWYSACHYSSSTTHLLQIALLAMCSPRSNCTWVVGVSNLTLHWTPNLYRPKSVGMQSFPFIIQKSAPDSCSLILLTPWTIAASEDGSNTSTSPLLNWNISFFSRQFRCPPPTTKLAEQPSA